MLEIAARQATLRRLREARALTQSTLADLLEMDLSTLKRFIEATGGELHLVVRYPDTAPVELLVNDH